MSYRILFFLCLWVGAGWVNAPKSQTLPTEPEAFFKALPDLISDGTDSRGTRDYMKSFEKVWNDPGFAGIRQELIRFAQALQKKKMRISHFKAFVHACENFYVHADRDEKTFQAWMKTLEFAMHKKSINGFLEYLQFSEQFFHTGILYQAGGHEWLVDNNRYQIELENDMIYFDFPSVNLKLRSKYDSSIVFNTRLRYSPLEQQLNFEGGEIYYDRLKIPHEKVYARLNKVRTTARRNNFVADSVWFTHTDYFSEPLLGRLEEKLTVTGEDRDSRFPKFDSYNKRFRIENLEPDIHYEGGFSFHGNRFLARGDSSEPATMVFMRKDEPFIRISAQNFSITDERISANPAAITIKIGEEDSMYHPGIDFKYLKKSKEFSALRIGDGLAETPFFNTYHKIDMYFEAMYWKTDEEFVRFSMARGSSASKATFRSGNYFSPVDDERYRGMDAVHPVTQVFNFLAKKEHPDRFSLLDLSKHMRADPMQIRMLLMRMSINGMFSFVPNSGAVIVNERFYNYYFARAGLKDYDVIEFSSQINGDNARLSLMDWRLDLKGVARITLSDSQSVFIYPENQELSLKKNRDFEFHGMIEAGKFAFYGKNFYFNYGLFKIDLVDVDSVKLAVQSFRPNDRGERPIRFVKTVIEGVKGELLIDEPGNKSGVKGLSQYPRLICNTDAYTYYDRPQIESGVYNRNSVFFRINPFELDSLDNFRTEQIRLPGTFVSGIFPDMDEELKVMDDYSLGFTTVAPEGGLDAYGGKGKFMDTLSLSHNGIRGQGTLQYLTSTVESDDFKFYPDSMNTQARRYGIQKTVSGNFETPDLKALDVYVHWEPEKDFMEVSETTKPMEMYEGEVNMHGKVTLTPEGLNGDGKMDFGNAEMESKEFRYRAVTYHADSSSFALRDVYENNDSSQVAFSTANIKADVSFEDRVGKFKSNSEESFVDFPMNSFKAYMDELEWFMDNNEVDMNTNRVDRLGLKGALFVSTDKRLDSLAFVAPVARFVLKTKTIYCEGVEYVDVADSRIFPIDKKINIQRNAKIDPLVNATVWVNRDKKLHVLDKGNITIHSRHLYRGSADYTYVDEMGKAQRIFFSTIDVENKTDITVANGNIEPVADFSMSPQFGFKGKVKLRGDKEFLDFDGYAKIIHTCGVMKNEWVRFSAEINPNNIMIPIPQDPVNDEQHKMFNGFMFASDSTGLYPAIFAAKRRHTDYEVMKASGYLTFDRKNQEFRVASKEKLEDRSLHGPYLSFNSGNCTSYAEGRMDLGSKMGQVELKAAGSILYYPDADSTRMNLMMTINFPFPEPMLKYLLERLNSVEGMGAGLQDPEVRKGLSDLLDSSRAEEVFGRITPEGKFRRMPKEFDRTFVFTGLELVWSKKYRTLMFEGPVGLPLFNGHYTFKTVNVLFDLNRKASGDIFTLILDISEDEWYFFQFRNNILTVYSNKKEFNQMLTSIDPKNRVYSAKGFPNLTLAPGSARRVDRFLQQFNRAMTGDVGTGSEEQAPETPQQENNPVNSQPE